MSNIKHLFSRILYIIIFLSSSLSVMGQITLTMKDKPLKKVIKQIEKVSEYRFFYNEDLANLNKSVSLKAQNSSIEKVLKDLSSQASFSYLIKPNYQIVLSDNLPSQQTRLQNITGRVVDTTDNPIIGANVLVKGTTNGVITDIDGNFSLEKVPVQSQLQISYIGYETKELAVVSGKTNVKIVMAENTKLLNEVVVTGFGLAQKKATLTGAIASVGADDISRSSAVNTSGALVGKVAGLNYRSADSRPGNATTLQIRNMGTPLFVIDGVQSDEGQFNNIDFNDIESISILKDASASIYGVRAANGVIVVTTKKGKKNTKSTVTLNTYYGWQHVSRLPEPADAVTYVENYIQSETIQGKTSRLYSKEDLEKWRQGTEKGYVPFNWYDYIWVTSPQYYVNANVSGGSDKINYYFSLGHMNQESAIRNYGGMKRYNVQMNVEAQITDKFKIGMNMNGRIKQLRNPGVPGTDDYSNPTAATYRNLPTVRPFANDNPNYPASVGSDNGLNFGLLNFEKSGTFEDTWRMVQLNLNAEYEIIKGLKAKALFGYYFANELLNNQEYTYRVYRYDEAMDEYVDVGGRASAWRERTNAHVEELTSNIQLAYEKAFGAHSINAIVGFEAIKRDAPKSWLHAIPASNSLHLIYYDTIDKFEDTGNNTQARLGWLGRFNYNYANKYLVDFSARYDGSWKFPPNHRWGFFPSASLGWRISEENFWKESKIASIFSNLKIRGSYGLVGDDNVDGYNAFDYMTGYDYKQGGGVIDGSYIIGTTPRNLPVTTLSWAKAKILDIGLDVAFLNNRLSGSVDFFRRIKTGIPASRDDVLLPEEVGFERPKENLNSNVHTGYDLFARWSDKVNDFHYSISANFTYSRFYNWEQYNPKFSNSWDEYRNSTWHRFGNINWAYESDGQFQSWDEIASWPIDNDQKGNTTLRPGDIKYVDQNGDGIINDMDKRPIGYKEDSTPVLNFGFNLAFAWKGFDLALDFSGAGMSTWNPTLIQKIPFNNNGNNPAYYMEDTWRLSDIFDANSELIPGKYPTLLIGNNANNHSNYWESSFWKYNVRYLKLRNLEFGYTFPKEWLQKCRINTLRLYLAGQNLFTLTNVPIDPEVSAGNGTAYPSMRIINLGLTLKF
jgi:TonB-linked SusC/RagA family outer membrane protein